MVNSVADYPIPVFLKKILADSLSGELYIKGEGFEKSLYLLDGILVSARSSQLDERIGVVLYMIGKISEELYNNISGLVHSVDKEVGEILVQNHFVSRQDLYSARVYLTRRIALSTFSLGKGSWQFKKEIPYIPESEKCFIQLPGIIVEGTRKMKSIAYFVNKIYFHSPKTTGIPKSLYPLLTEEEILFYRKLETCKNLSNREIISKLNFLPDFYWEKIVVFLMLDLVGFVEHAVHYDQAENIESLLKLNEKLENGTANAHDILGVEKAASLEEIEHAYHIRARQYHPDRFGSAAAPEIKRIARFVSDSIEDAYQSLIKEASQEIKLPLDITPQDKSDPRYRAKLLFDSAQELFQREEYQEAIPLLKEAVKIVPNRGKYYYLLGLCQAKIIYFHGDAERNLKKGIELEPWNADPVYALGMLFRKQNKFKLSEKCFQHVLEIDKGHYEAGKAIAELHRSRASDNKGSFFSIFKTKA